MGGGGRKKKKKRQPPHLPDLRTPQSAMDKRMHSPGASSIDQLPDDVLLLIISFLTTLAEVARTSILGRRWRNLWLYSTCLDFDATTVLPIERLETSHDWYIAWVNKFVDARAALPGLFPVKELRIRYELDASQGFHIDRWIDFAIANRVETLHLEFCPYEGIVFYDHQYILSEERWHRVPSGLSSLKCLKSLSLWCVSASKQFIEFILSSCPLLEDMSLYLAGTYVDLDISGAPPLQLRRLKIVTLKQFALTKLCAPYLTSFFYKGAKFNPEKINVPMLTDLTIGGRPQSQHIMEYLVHFWIYLPQLVKLDLIMYMDQDFRLMEMPELVKLKYLKIRVNWDTDPIFDQIINFINACPLLETFAFEILMGRKISSRLSSQEGVIKQIWQRAGMSCFKCLKVLELYDGDGKTIDQEVIRFIINKSPCLEKLMVDIRSESEYPKLQDCRPEIAEVVKAKAEKLCQGSGREIEITVLGG